MSRFEGRVALVTGASSGVGRAVARQLAAEGAAVGVVGRDPATLGETVAEIERSGGRALAVPADVGVEADVRRAIDDVVSAYGGVDLVSHAAGVLRMGPVTDLDEADWDLLFATNAKSCFLLVKHAVPVMRERGGGAVVTVSSVFAHAATRGAAAYAASKAAVIALSRTMALDHIDDGVRINCVAPGSMRTPMLEAIARRTAPDDPEGMLAAAGRLHPIGRLVEPDEVADLVVYLLSDAASAIVGECVTIDGGRLAKLGSAE